MEHLSSEQLEQAMSFAQYQSTLTEQRILLKQKFEDACIVPFNGGLFKVTQEWLGGFDHEASWFLDSNGIPIQISNSAELYSAAKSAYTQAIVEYGEAYQQLRKQRSVRALTEL